MKEKKGNKKVILIILGILIVIGVIVFFVYNSNTNSSSIGDNKAWVEVNPGSGKKLYIYKYTEKDNAYRIEEENEVYDNLELTEEFKCQTDECTAVYNSGDNAYVLIYDEEYLLYDPVNKKALVFDNAIDEITDYIVLDSSDNSLIENPILVININQKSNFISLIDQKTLITLDENISSVSWQVNESGKSLYYMTNVNGGFSGSPTEVIILDKDFNRLHENEKIYNPIFKENGELILSNGKQVFVYNADMSVKTESTEFADAIILSTNNIEKQNYFIALDKDNNVRLYDFENKEIANITKLENGESFNKEFGNYSYVENVQVMSETGDEPETLPEGIVFDIIGNDEINKTMYYNTDTKELKQIESLMY